MGHLMHELRERYIRSEPVFRANLSLLWVLRRIRSVLRPGERFHIVILFDEGPYINAAHTDLAMHLSECLGDERHTREHIGVVAEGSVECGRLDVVITGLQHCINNIFDLIDKVCEFHGTGYALQCGWARCYQEDISVNSKA